MAQVKLKIGTRASPLAVAQAQEVGRLLAAAHGWERPADGEGGAVEIVRMTTTGDRVRDRPLAAIGGKGLFTKEIEKALISGEVDLAVHSMKDMPAELPPGLVITATPEREDPRDAFIGGPASRLADLPRGAVIGTCSLRRKAQALMLRPDFRVVNLRGNVQTRLGKVESGELDGTLLALAGLKRLGLERHASEVVADTQMLPAIGQGTLCIETRADDERSRALVDAIHHPATGVVTAAERAFLARLGGSCRMPVAGLAELRNETVYFRGAVYVPDGSRAFTAERSGPASDAAVLGRDAADEIRRKAGADFLAAFVAAQ